MRAFLVQLAGLVTAVVGSWVEVWGLVGTGVAVVYIGLALEGGS